MADLADKAILLERANALKDEGNRLLEGFKYAQAAEKYTEAINLCPSVIFYSNRALALIKLESFGAAISDANEAISLDPKYIKAYYRRGSANFALGKLKAALKDFKAVVKIVPNDAEARKKLAACERAAREEAFSKAIVSDSTSEPASQKSVNTEDITVEESYTGPRLETRPDGTPVFTTDFVRALIEHFKQQKLPHRKYVIQLLQEARHYFQSLSSLLRVQMSEKEDGSLGQFTVCGDTHGQFYDLCNIFEVGGFPSAANPYLFNGDFVDRGSFSFEVVFTLLALKLAEPSGLHLLRGNHESKNMNRIYGFEGEVKHKYDDTVMGLFTDVFNWLPLCAVIQDSVFVVHGGLSTEKNVTLADIAAVPRGREPPESGLMSDLLWSDPQPQPGRAASKRGVGFSFGPDITAAFLEANGLSLLIRSHEVKDAGYVVEHDGKCITVFSAPNYCDQMGNMGAFVRFEGDMTPQFTQFSATAHPNIPPMRYAGMFGQFGL
mmetsp:Transcript_360/g.353  ORF Transcript_360/g.353 Transcript_360/m.353 type:complete len:494 (-) Transcript_360:187-1668(-)|eukprot:CAMPEP_0182430380 /NCGR_PEP_ID=MMETSP1167-20130531/40057_1 /TAXON_ID=2988 /ORGANISM="Mallomonas Sp, Strain CCMP3275" /LENGTH=493 /DNA_ID=CAMNT_0024615413 /DNA_START=85 /DNA_END=1566 /DNA_ORIENTATION=-